MSDLTPEDRALFELLPCPFCGGTPITGRDPTCRNLWRITCRNCDAGPSSSLSEEGARNSWNRRTQVGRCSPGEGSDRAKVRHCASRSCKDAGRCVMPLACNLDPFMRIDRDWFERKAALEGDQEIGAGASSPPPSGEVRTFGQDATSLESLWSTLRMCEAAKGHIPGHVTVHTSTFRDMLAAIPTRDEAADKAAYMRGWNDRENEFLGRASMILPEGSGDEAALLEPVAWRWRLREGAPWRLETENPRDDEVEVEPLYAAPQAPAAELPATFQERVAPWMTACFGAEIAADRLERNDRFIEEALELVQASDYPAERAHALVDYVYGRPQGDINQEVGGVMITLAAHCLAHGIDMHAAGETELARIWTKVEQIRAKQAAKPKGSALPIAQPSAEGGEHG